MYTGVKLIDQHIELSIKGLVLKSDFGSDIQIKIEKSIELEPILRIF